ncbi:MAG TPA: hypothetical protein VGK59_04495 [Ohtaekwangia sp.]
MEIDNTDIRRTKSFYIEKYKELKEIKGGRKPLRHEFLKFCKAAEINLFFAFGKNAYSTLQAECGDAPDKFRFEKIPMSQILDQYGELARKYQRIPVTADWLMDNLYVLAGERGKIHQLPFSKLPEVFIKSHGDKMEWQDVVNILEQNDEAITKEEKNKEFNELVERIVNWNPDSKRIITGYKIELRSYLEKFYNVEEGGDQNAGLLIHKKYPIEVKNDPSLSEYDRLLGQMIYHTKHFGYSITVVTDISSVDLFKKFQRLFVEIHEKLEMTAELIRK